MKTFYWEAVLPVAFLGLALATVAFAADAKKDQAKMDALLVAAQKICPVTGEELGSMGDPIKTKMKTKLGEQTLFLCCKGCKDKPIEKKNWAVILANLAKAQGQCPVTDDALPKNAGSVLVKNRLVFVCCKDCIKKVQADPDKYLARVDALLDKNLAKQEKTK